MDNLQELQCQIASKQLTRRDVLKRAMELGLTAPVIAVLLASCGGDDQDEEPEATEALDDQGVEAEATEALDDEEPEATEALDDEEPEATEALDDEEPEATEALDDEEPARGRGQGGDLRIVYVNAQSILNPHLAGGSHEQTAATFVLEPLIHVDPLGNVVPGLVKEVPSLENGDLAEDGTSVTYRLLEGVVWSDGTPFTAEDVRFTWEYITHPEINATTAGSYGQISDVEVVDEHTVTIHFTEPTPLWFVPFSSIFGSIIPKHELQDYVGVNAKEAPFNIQPIGTGPYKVSEFRPGDILRCEINDQYRLSDKPFFRTIELQGGLDGALALRSVLTTEEAHYTWFIQLEWDLIQQWVGPDAAGELIISDATDVERIALNLTDPWTEVDGEFSKFGTSHPFQSDRAVREAFTYVIDRDTIVTNLYGDLGRPTSNVLAAPARFASPNTSYEFNLEKAAELLDEAGWIVQDGVRQKDGTPMRIVFHCSQLSVRQRYQEVIKAAVEEIGIEMQLTVTPGSVYFSSEPGNPDTMYAFHAEWQTYATGPRTPYPISYMAFYISIDPERDIPQRANDWASRNIMRWVNEEFNDLYQQALFAFDPEEQERLFIRMNDIMVMEDIVEIPFMHRNLVAAKNKKLKGVDEGTQSPFSSEFWNIQDWYWEE